MVRATWRMVLGWSVSLALAMGSLGFSALATSDAETPPLTTEQTETPNEAASPSPEEAATDPPEQAATAPPAATPVSGVEDFDVNTESDAEKEEIEVFSDAGSNVETVSTRNFSSNSDVPDIAKTGVGFVEVMIGAVVLAVAGGGVYYLRHRIGK